ncbi:MAG: bifunctional demethylmenaquinone methyltransferase/2-methoxy-6-polyprenyl-1,4-benzoquinol methylase UbiE [Deinococcus sp.]|nr:bifunctional demethylmenaquinone methyltransferase/2-methoxy-6-polyprenyl-1,4-benzoquinol methylase UbiE [Deinococcus sp.]
MDKATRVQQLFARIAPRYDLLNQLLSAGVDRSWRRQAARWALAGGAKQVLDVATGTAELALELKRQAPGAQVVGLDFVPDMLAIGRRKAQHLGLDIELRTGDALAMPFHDQSFDAVTIAFGLRNLTDRAAGLKELRRVLCPGGRLVVLEFPPPPRGFWGSVYRCYFQQLLPAIGGLVSGSRTAYLYLPESVVAFPPPAELARLMERCGFAQVQYQLLTGGIAALHCGVRP